MQMFGLVVLKSMLVRISCKDIQRLAREIAYSFAIFDSGIQDYS